MNAAEAQLEVASHLAEAQQQLARAVLALRGLSLFDQNTSTVGGAGAAKALAPGGTLHWANSKNLSCSYRKPSPQRSSK